MFRKQSSDRNDGEDLLGRALRALPVPEISSDFNSRIHQELAESPHTRVPYWSMLRPGLYAMGASFALTIVMLSLFSGSTQPNATIKNLNAAVGQRPGRPDEVESLIERSDLTSASIRMLLLPESTALPSLPSLPPGATPQPSSRPATRTHRLQGA